MFIKRLKRLEKLTPTMLKSNISRLEQVLKEKDITRYQIVRDTGLTYKTLSGIVDGKNERFQSSHLIIIATYLNVSVSELFIKEKLID